MQIDGKINESNEKTTETIVNNNNITDQGQTENKFKVKYNRPGAI